jgi:uncharacterized protein YciI
MPFLIDATDGPGTAALRQTVRPEHLAYLEANQAMLLAAGAKLSDDAATASGSFYIVATESRAVAEAFVAADPFARSGVFDTITLQRWRKGFFDFKRQPASGT